MFTKYIISSTFFVSLLFAGAPVRADILIFPFPNYSALPVFYPPAYRELGSEGDQETSNEALMAQSSNFTPIYVPSKSLRTKNLANFVNKIRTKDPVGAAQMEQIFASTDIVVQISGLMQNIGLHNDNAPDAYAVYLVSAWQAVNSDTSAKSRESYEAVTKQTMRGLSRSTEFAQTTDAQKQEMAEAMMVQTAMIGANMKKAAGDPAKLKAISKVVKQVAAASGLELGKMTLTKEGFIPNKRR